MLTCMYQPPVTLGKTCQLRVNRDTKKVTVKQFSPKRNGHIRVELVKSYNFLSPKRQSVIDIDKARRQPRSVPQPSLSDEEDDDEEETDPESDDGSSSLSESCGLSISELEEMAACQARQLETQEQLLAAKAQRLRYLKSGGEAERLMRLREKVATQEERLRKLRALRGKVQSSKQGNAVLSSDLESLRAVFNEKEKELSVAVAKVDELTRQLEDIRHGTKDGNGTFSNLTGSNGQSPASVELEKLRRELLYRQKLREAQATRVADQRAKISQRQEEANRVDRRIAELQERLHRKRFLNHQLAATLKQQENVEEILENGMPTKNDSKYQTLPYNSKFTSFGVKHLTQNYQDSQQQQNVQDQVAKFDKAIQQMQIITLDQHRHQQPQLSTENNKLTTSNYTTNFQQLHQVLSQNHHNTKSVNNVNCSSNSGSVIADSTLSNGVGHGLPQGKGKFMSPIGENHELENVGCPVIRPNNFTPAGAPHPVDNNVGLSSQGGTTRDVTSSGGSNGSINATSSDGIGPTYTNTDGKGLRPALPPKPSKPPPPPSRQPSAGEIFPYIQRSLSTGDGIGMMPDRTELPIKPKPLFVDKPSSTSSSSGNESFGTSVPPLLSGSTIRRHGERELLGTGNTTNAKNNNGKVRVSINRRIEMPPAFLFPESDPPPSDLVPEQYSSTTSSLSSTSLTSSVSSTGGTVDSIKGNVELNDCVDASPLLQSHQKVPSHHGLEEYTLPDLFPTTPSPTTTHLNGESNFRPHLLSHSNNVKLTSPNNNTNYPFPSTMTTLATGVGHQENNKMNYSNNNCEESSPLQDHSRMIQSPTTGSPLDTNTKYEVSSNQERYFEQQQVALMSLHLDNRKPGLSFEQDLSLKPKQRESSDAVNVIESEKRSEQTAGGYENENRGNGSCEPATDNTENGDTTNKFPHLPGIIKRFKKGNLKSAHKDPSSTGRRVSFDPLALLLDASLEGELELVMKTAKEVGNPSAANDEGITALHNAICAGHSDVVYFLVEFGCDVNAQDSDGWTPLHCAASCNNTGMVKFLVEHGACIFATTLSDHETAAEKCEEDEDGFGPCSEYLYSMQEKLGIINNGVVYAVFDYEAQNPDELTFETGNRLDVLRKGDEVEREWWWSKRAEKNEQGYIPKNLLGLYPRVIPEKRKAEC